MARKKLSFRIRLFKGNRPVAQNKLRYATAFEVWYGKRRVLGRTPFTALTKRVAERRELLSSTIFAIDLKRRKLLEKRRRIAKRKRQEKLLREIKRKSQRRISRKPKDFEEQYRELYIDQLREADKSIPQFEKLRAEEPVTAIKANVLDTIIIPVIPEGKGFSKRIIDKEMWKRNWGHYHLSTLDFSLDETSYIPMTAETFKDSYKEATRLMLPHIVRYFEETKGSAEYYILRLKFLNNWIPEDPYERWGISFFRSQVKEPKQIIGLFRDTFLQLFGDERFGPTSKNLLRRNYLEGEKLIFITGFTLEASSAPT